MYIRYIRDWIQGSTSNTGNHWVQIAAWSANRANMTITDAASNVAYLKSCTSTDSGGSGRTIAQVTDGDTSSTRYFGGGVAGYTYVQVDLNGLFDVDFVQVWHYNVDNRTYFQHKIEVSQNGTDWIVAQQPECNVKEISTGTYYLLMQDITGAVTFRLAQTELQTAIANAVAKRGGSTPTFSTIPVIGNALPASILNEVRTSLEAVISLTHVSAVADQVVGPEWPQTRTDYHKLNSGYGTCNTGCTFTCAVSCNVYCGTSCATNCYTGCSTGCYTGCTGSCNTTCSASCGGSCSAGGACSGSACTSSCYANCKSNCSCIFSSSCGSGCSYRCSGSCTASCGGQCQGSCGSQCNSYCGALCTSSCGVACSTSCGNQCGALCGATCSKGCENSCTAFTNSL